MSSLAEVLLVAICGIVVGIFLGSVSIRDSVFKDCEALGGWRMSGKHIACSVKAP